MKDDHSWAFFVLWAGVIVAIFIISKVIIEAVVESDMPMWLKIMLLK